MQMADEARKTCFGRYEVLAKIGRGGTATVYLARPEGERTARPLALKVLHTHKLDDLEAVRSFLYEARVTSRIQHVNVLPILEVGWHGGRPFMVMDYVEGCSVADILGASPRVRPPLEIVTIVLDTLAGLSAVHNLKNENGDSYKLVHRDVSPANLLVGVDGACRVTDFGVTRGKESKTEAPFVSIRGTPGYVAPEVVAGWEIDARADLFSVGVVLWNALTGRRLFQGESVGATLFNVMQRRIPPPSQVGLRPPPCFDKICLTATHRDPAKRFQSAEHMAEALRTVALEESLFGTREQVARLVDGLFGEQLAARRHAIDKLLATKGPLTIEEPDRDPASDSAPPVTLEGLDGDNAMQDTAPSVDELRLAHGEEYLEALRTPEDPAGSSPGERARGVERTAERGVFLRRNAKKLLAVASVAAAGLVGFVWLKTSQVVPQRPAGRFGPDVPRRESPSIPPPSSSPDVAPALDGTGSSPTRSSTWASDDAASSSPVRRGFQKRRARTKSSRAERAVGKTPPQRRRASPPPSDPTKAAAGPEAPRLERNPYLRSPD